jgi:hypothetical protein
MFCTVGLSTVHPFQMICDVILPPVVSADTTTLAESFQDNKTSHFYVEVRAHRLGQSFMVGKTLV